MGETNGNGASNGVTQSTLERNIRLVERLGVLTTVLGYFLYKDFVFTEKQTVMMAKLLQTQDQIAEAVKAIALLVNK